MKSQVISTILLVSSVLACSNGEQSPQSALTSMQEAPRPAPPSAAAATPTAPPSAAAATPPITLEGLAERIRNLEDLQTKLRQQTIQIGNLGYQVEKSKKENQRLKEENQVLKGKIQGLEEEIQGLKEEIKTEQAKQQRPKLNAKSVDSLYGQ